MELSTEQISEQTGIPKASVTAMVSAARKKVFTELKRRMKTMLVICIILAGLLGAGLASVMTEETEKCRNTRP